MEKINLRDYVKTGEGANGESFDSLLDPNVMVKLYNVGYDTSTIISEQEVAHKVFELGVPSPEPGELITDGERIGIRFRKITGKRSFSRVFADEPQRVPEFAREFARYCKKLHSIEVPEGLFPDNKELFLSLLEKVNDLSPRVKEYLKDFITTKIPSANTALHGDMHFGNVLTTLPKGAPLSAPHEVYFIDLGYFAVGCPLMDLGMTYNICNWADESFILHDMHFGKETARIAWENFVKEYFPGEDINKVDEMIKPYAAVKLLLVDYNIGSMPPNYIKYMEELAK